MTNLPKHKKKSKPKNKSKAEKLFENAIQIARDVITNGDHVPRSTSRKKSKPVPYGIVNEADEEHGGSGDEYEDNEEEETTPWHIARGCPCLISLRSSIFGLYILYLVEWAPSQLSAFLRNPIVEPLTSP